MNTDKLITIEELICAIEEFDDVFVAFNIFDSDEYGVNKMELDADGNLCLSDDGEDDFYTVDSLVEALNEYDEEKKVYVTLQDECYYIDSESAEFDDDTDDEDEYEVVVTVYTEEDYEG